jgi:glutamate dehydrogenase
MASNSRAAPRAAPPATPRAARRAAQGAEYLREFLAASNPDRTEAPPAQLAAAARALLKFAARRRRAQALVRVFNPTLREHGFDSGHTVIQIATDDMPFLVDSVGLVLTRRGSALHLLAHPVYAVRRDRAGRLRAIGARAERAMPASAQLESFQHLEIDRIVGAAALTSLRHEIEHTLRDVRVACADWGRMQAAVRRAAAELGAGRARQDAENLRETRALLQWMIHRHFLLLGSREYRLVGKPGREALAPIEASGLGILRRGHPQPESTRPISAQDIRRQARSRDLALVTKSNIMSSVHRAGYLDYVGVKVFDRAGRPSGERRFLGLWTSAAYSANPHDIPLVGAKVARVVAHFALAPDSHDGKTLAHVLNGFPRDELFQATVPELIRIIKAVLGLQERPCVRLMLRRDPFHRFYSCLIFVPREKYDADVRQRIETVIRTATGAFSLESQVHIAQSNLARLHVVARVPPGAAGRLDPALLEVKIAAAVRSWSDEFKAALLAGHEEALALELYEKYAGVFPAAYTEDFPAEVATRDAACLEAVEREPARLHAAIYRPEPRNPRKFFLKLYRGPAAIPISDLVPMFENMGLRVIAERPYGLDFPAGRQGWIQDLELELVADSAAGADVANGVIIEALTAVFTGRAENDALNQLTVYAGLPWRTVTVLRAYCRYLLQTGLPFSHGYLAQVLAGHPAIARLLADLFALRFDPDRPPRTRARALKRLDSRLHAALEAVQGSDQDRILRALHDVVNATVRTNAFQPGADGAAQDHLAFKISSQQLRELPLPKPLWEIFVFSPRMEGIHLRMGRVARGGIRWSDRREDFRTEILGLMKAQNVKNTMIVPVGAKGGFVLKRALPAARDAQQSEVVACYQTLIRGLLDLTDNIVGDRVVAPARVVRHDEDDPYLVVAADKGTATFSDIANAISTGAGFWLGDAFASGGSAGYDHKKMAITARGAWECVKRHFREMGRDPQAAPFTVVGIGDMAGDVFGNGMLRSPQIRLVAAFNHQHIFLDPNPDPAVSLRERRRLFALPRSSWADYSPRCLSPGGGVFPRSAKRVTVSREVQALLHVAAEATPNEIVRAILAADVDLLWNGGIGTYVKAAGESHADVGDRGNDAVRIDARQLRCKVVGEGGNLGLSQRARIEYARSGGRLNTDFIDNSAGVNCSDVEVNLKILLSGAVRAGELTLGSRDRLLERMTDEVAALVLRNNYLQSQAISALAWRARERLGEDGYLIAALERAGDLNRRIEYLPSDEDLAERRKTGAGLTRPELAVLLSYGKISTYKSLIQSSVPEDRYLGTELARYFPAPVRRRFAQRIAKHRLRREIIATAITNSLVNRMGPVFALRAQQDLGADPAAIARAYTIAREVLGARALWHEIEALDSIVPAALQYAALADITNILRHFAYWFLTHRPHNLDIDAAVRRFGPRVRELLRDLPACVAADERERQALRARRLTVERVPAATAERLAALETSYGALDLAEVSAATRLPIGYAARAYFELGARLGLTWLKRQIESLADEGHWHAVARGNLRETLYALQRRITAASLSCRGGGPAARVDAWMALHTVEVGFLKGLVTDLSTGHVADFATLSVALQSVRRLAES